MKCLINTAIERAIREHRSVGVIQRYLRLKYRISIPKDLLMSRIQKVVTSAA